MTLGDRTRRRNRSFTLVELLVVMAITAILLGLIFGPLIQGFNLTNRARVQVLTQDQARSVMETIQRDLANGVFVFDNTGETINIWVRHINGSSVAIPMPYAFIDIVPPARENDQNPVVLGEASNIDPTTGLAIDRGKLSLPLAPGRVIIRYWLGLRDNASLANRPIKPYLNVYEEPPPVDASAHNPYILYRAIVSPYLPNGAVDTRLFHTDSQGRPILFDPNFFYDSRVVQAPQGLDAAMLGWKDDNGDGKVNYCENWKAVARAMVPTDRADLITLQRGPDRRPIYYNDLPRVTTLVKFQPTFVGNDAGAPSSASDAGNEAPQVAPSSYFETHGHWITPFRVYVIRSPLNAPVLEFFYWEGTGNVELRRFDTATSNLTRTDTGFNPNSPSLSPGASPMIMFTVDPVRGMINFAFPDSILLHDAQGRPLPSTFDPAEANRKFNEKAQQDGNPLNAYRYISLANLDPALNPNVQSPLATIPNVSIVPGSEVVRGPDMRPGPHYGKEITYTRVRRSGDPRQIGPNEYMINYTDIPNPDGSTPTDPLQKMGTIIFNSRPDSPGVPNALPERSYDQNGQLTESAAPITVTYQIQNNLPTDVVKVDYITRELMTVSVGVRLFDLRSGQPQQVTLTQKIKVRNLQR
jgi:type II secretory pathway pseudopilin PulG